MSTTASAQEAQATPGPSKRKIAKLARRRAITSVLVLLAEIWPQCFFLHQIRRRPLKIGILGEAALEGKEMEANPILFRDLTYIFLAALAGGLAAWRLRLPLIFS